MIRSSNATTVKPAAPANVFLGRQPILDRQKNLFAYELLYRSNQHDNFFSGIDGDAASSQTINNTVNVMNLASISGGRKVFVNITRQLLLHDLYMILPANQTVIELLENVQPDTQVIQACMRLKDAGYLLALDDFVFHPGYEPLLSLADFIKVEFLGVSSKKRAEITEQLSTCKACLLAEKVETQDDFAEGLDLGYSLFQGYFFSKPEIIAERELPPFKRNYLRFLQQATRPKLDFAQLEQIVKEEPSLSIKLLRYLNSAMFGMRAKVESIKQALAMLGERQLRQWASLVALTSLGDDKPGELMTLCLVRARFCEEMSSLTGMNGRELDMFLMGMLSALDALVDRPLSEMLAEMPLAHDVKAALLGSTTQFGTIYGLVVACERGNKRLISFLATKIAVPEERIAQTYCAALQWADDVLHA